MPMEVATPDSGLVENKMKILRRITPLEMRNMTPGALSMLSIMLEAEAWNLLGVSGWTDAWREIDGTLVFSRKPRKK